MTHPAINTATRLLEAIVRGEHLTVWELLSPAGRDYVLETGGRRGLDPVQAARVRQGTSQPHERDRFLTSVLQGLRVDFSSVELEQVAPTGVHRTLPDGRVEVPLACPATFGSEPWAAGTIVLVEQPTSDGGTVWLVERVHPLVSRRE